jgi:hypothetical protein
MFKPIRFDSGRLVKMPAKATIAFQKGDAVVDDGNGYLTLAASSTAVDVKFVAWENKTIGASDGELLLCYRVVGGVQIEADTDANPAQTDVHTFADLASDATLNPDASTNDLFYIEYIKGALADKKVVGHFAEGVPNS